MIKPSIISCVLLALACCLPGCGPEISQGVLNSVRDPAQTSLTPGSLEPVQNELFVFASDEYPIACYFFDPKRLDYGQSLPMFNQAWVWASAPNYSYLLAEGPREDGFILARKVRGYSLLYGKSMKSLVNTTDALEDLCQKSIDQEYPNKGLKLYEVAASRSLAVREMYPLVVGEKNSRNLITRMIVFGDSMSDTGRLKNFLQVFPNPPYFLGRFSNGPIWVDFLPQVANIAIQNHSTGGAVTKPELTYDTSEIIKAVRERGRHFVTGSVSKFIEDYLKEYTENGKIKNPERTLLAVWAGANDYFAKFDSNTDLTRLIDEPDLEKRGGRSIARISVENIAQNIIRLYEAGGRNFLIGNMANLGMTPVAGLTKNYRANDETLTAEMKNYMFSSKLSEIMDFHNTRLSARLALLREELPGIRIVLFDVHKALYDFFHERGPDGEEHFDYGIDVPASFTALKAPGQKDLFVGKKCYLGGYLGSSNDQDICENAHKVLFWDEVHITSAGHCAQTFLLHDLLYKEKMVDIKPDYAGYRQMCGF